MSLCNIGVFYFFLADKRPTYGELIDLLQEVEQESPNNENLLYSKFKELYPKIYVGCPRRFYETVTHLEAPTKSSLRGKSGLTGSLLTSYWKRSWQPRLHNLGVKGRDPQSKIFYLLK